MRRFQKRPDVTFAIIPGVGRLDGQRILEGDQYAKFAPSLLVEIPAGPDAAPLTEPKPTAPGPAPMREVRPRAPTVIVPPPPPPAPAHAPELLADTVETPIHIPPEAKRPPASMADAGFTSPEELAAVVADENKQTEAQIDRAVERLTPVDESDESEAKESEHKESHKKKEAPKPHHAPKPHPKKPSGRK